jgi:hypothetical protein
MRRHAASVIHGFIIHRVFRLYDVILSGWIVSFHLGIQTHETLRERFYYFCIYLKKL